MPIEATKDNFASLTSEGKVLVDFWGPRCQPCLALMPAVAALEEESAGAFHVVKVDSTQNLEICRQLKVLSLPTFIVMKDGNEVARITGGDLSISDIRKALDDSEETANA
jgi:thioredoxin 1